MHTAQLRCSMPCCSFIKDKQPTSCIVELLDSTELRFPIRATDNGSILIDKVCGHLDLYEKDYFGLRFINSSNKTSYWLDLDKNVLKQLKRYGVTEKKPRFYFSVKFYAVDPCSLKEELTRYLFFLQLRNDVATGRIIVDFDCQAELGALAVQAELGDYDPSKHFDHYMDSLCLSETSISHELELAITKLHKAKYFGYKASRCELLYLDLVRKQNGYGVQIFNVKGSDNTDYRLGISPHGLLQYEGKTKRATHTWPLIDAVDFNKSTLHLRVRDSQASEPVRHKFKCSSTKECKQLWKSSVEHHAFFRLTKAHQPSTKGHLFHLGSKYRYSGRTAKDIAGEENRKQQPQVRRNSVTRRSSVKQEKTELDDVNVTIKPETEVELRKPDIVSSTEKHEGSSVSAGDKNKTSESGLFSTGRTSPGSIRSLRMKFSGATGTDNNEYKNNRNRRSRHGRSSLAGSDTDSVTSSVAFKRSYHGWQAHRPSDRVMHNDSYSDALRPSSERIINGYIKDKTYGNSNVDRRRHSDRSMYNPRLYENIAYDSDGRPIVEPQDEKIPAYQQEWANRQPQNHHAGHHRPVANKTRASFSTVYNYDDYLHNRQAMSAERSYDQHHHNMAGDMQWGFQVTKSQSFGFYEDQMISRDSGTDSPSYYHTDEPHSDSSFADMRDFRSHDLTTHNYMTHDFNRYHDFKAPGHHSHNGNRHDYHNTRDTSSHNNNHYYNRHNTGIYSTNNRQFIF